MNNNFFKIENENGIWWFISPKGDKFLSKGICTVSYEQDLSQKLGYSPYRQTVDKKYSNYKDWAIACTERLKNIGINTVGAWSSREVEEIMPYTKIIAFLEQAKISYRMNLIDIFNDRFKEECFNFAKREIPKLQKDKNLIGYFVENEIDFGNNWINDDSLFDKFFQLNKKAEGKKELVNTIISCVKNIEAFNKLFKTNFLSFFDLMNIENSYEIYKNILPDLLLAKTYSLRKVLAIHDEYAFSFRHKNVDDLNKYYNTNYSSLSEAVRDEKRTEVSSMIVSFESNFLSKYANRFYSVANDSIKTYDKNHLLLGSRYGGLCAEEVVCECAKYNDVISINKYDDEPPCDYLKNIYNIAQKPVLITEFSTRGSDTGHKNTIGGGAVVPTQKERTFRYKRYAEEVIKLPFVLGYHWFEHCDEPFEGRFDGEDCNYGIVNIDDELYVELTEQMKKSNAIAEKLHLRK